jgi:hypothetical protein
LNKKQIPRPLREEMTIGISEEELKLIIVALQHLEALSHDADKHSEAYACHDIRFNLMQRAHRSP